MRWFCVAPALPNKAVLRIRTAPNSDADVCGRFSKGKAIAAFANVVDIRDDADPTTAPQKWLHVAFQDEHTGRWSQGYVMASLPDGMTLLVPWEEAGFIRCCNIDEARAILYDSAAMNAQIVGTVDAGEGTRFAYGVAEAAGHRLRIFHDVYDSVWINADDTDTVCEKIEHPNCTVPHSYFTLNEALPAEAQIAIRAFPSREAETVALLSRGQVVEALARCGNWLQVMGADGQDAWIMWQTNTLQLLTELPFHTSGGCQLTTTATVESSVETDLPEDAVPEETVGDVAVEAEETEAEIHATSNGEQRPSLEMQDSSLSGDQDMNGAAHTNAASETPATFETQKSPVTNLCDELASNGISSLEEVLTVEPTREVDANATLPWDERPLNGHGHHDNPEVLELPNAREEIDQAEETVEEAVVEDSVVEAPTPVPTSSWEDRPISAKGQGSYSYQFDEAAAFPASQVQTKEPSYSWEDRPIATKSRGAYDWESSLGDVEVTVEQSQIVSEPPVEQERSPLQEQPSPPERLDEREEYAQDQEAQPEADNADEKEDDQQTAFQQLEGGDAPSSETEGPSKVAVMSWDDMPIKSRHVQEAASAVEAEATPPKLTPRKRALDTAERPWNTSARRTPPTKRADGVDSTSADGNGSASSSPSRVVAVHPPVGVIAADKGSVAWHSSDIAEDAGAFATSDDAEVENTSGSLQHSPRAPHSSHSAVGVVSGENVVSWHSVDTLEAPEDINEESANANDWGSGDAAIDEDEIDAVAPPAESSPIEVDEDHEYQHEPSHEDMEDDAGHADIQDEVDGAEMDVQDGEDYPDEEMKCDPVAFEHMHHHEQEDEAMCGEHPHEAFAAVDDESTAAGDDFEAEGEDGATAHAEDEPLALQNAAPVGMQSRLMARLTGLAGDRQDRILAAIAFNEGPDAILEALASADDYDEDLLKYNPPIGPPTAVAPSPSTSESGLLDVLYSRDQSDGFSTPTKKRPLSGSNQASARNSYSGENKIEILAGILRRTPQKSRESHNKIVGNANPEEILEAEFGSCADELGLFGDYQYPAVAPTRFSSANFSTPTRAASLSMSSLPSPSFGSAASFASPVPKENPLKRSASAIAKTPPVNLAKAASAPTRVQSPPPPPPPPAQAPQKVAAAPKRVLSPPPPPPPPVQVPAPIQVPEKTIPVRSRTPSGLVPPGAKSGIATGLPRPTLVSPSISTSQLRRPGTGALLSPTAGASRTRSFTTSDEVRERASLPGAPPPAMARAQSMLPRKSMLPTPSPSKLAAPSPTSRFGLTRATSLSSATASTSTPAAVAAPASASATASASTTPSLLARRTSFGFSRPTPTKKT